MDYDFFDVKVECGGPYGFAAALTQLSCISHCHIFNFGSKGNTDLSWFTGYIHFKAPAGKFTVDTLEVMHDVCLRSMIRALPSNNSLGAVFEIRKV